MARTGHPLRQGAADSVHLAHRSAGGGGAGTVLRSAEYRPRFGRFIESVSPLAFSVYLIHAHPLIWEHWLAGRFAFLADKPPILLASGVLGGAFAIYLVCSLADVLRQAYSACSVSKRFPGGRRKPYRPGFAPGWIRSNYGAAYFQRHGG